MKYAHWLDNIPGISRGKIFRILDQVETPAELFECSDEAVRKLEGITEEDAKTILISRRTTNPDELLSALTQRGISFVSYLDKDYPAKLRNIADPPFALYYIGHLPDENKYTVAIVGARGRSAYGMEVTQKLAQELAREQVQIISGMARGVDGDAHKGALKENGATYAVLGCGVDHCYPAEHRYLYEQIPADGGVLSEYPPGTLPIAKLFPARNRIISGLSDCVVVTEAKKKSGSLITADYAMEQGKDVYVVPGRITDTLSQGCNTLIRQGAGIILDIEDFKKELSLHASPDCIQIDFRKNLLEKDECLVYSLLDFCPTTVGTLLEKTAFSLLELLELLERMEQKGLILEIAPNYYVQRI